MDSSRYNEELSKKLEKSLSLSTEEMDTYQRYVSDGKDAARQGNMSKSLELLKLAHNIHPNEKLQNRIKKVQEAIQVMAQQDSESEDEEFVDVNNSGLLLFKELHDKLYHHQKEGVAFLYGLYRDGRKGGILADDMGLGKTIQVISFLSGMYDAELAKNSLLVMPTSLIKIWTKEFAKWTPGMRVKEFHGPCKSERNRNLEKIQRRGGVLVTTYQMLVNNWELLASHNGQEFKWDYVILDEAHKIKTPSTKSAKSAHAVPARNRVLLTGTPVQNNLREMWALFDFACHGSLLGTSKTFKTEYENPITRAREKCATPGEKALGLKMSENLMTIINPYFLRRTKAEVQRKKQNTATSSQDDLESDDKENKVQNHNGAIMPNLTRKNDLIVWTYLSTIQEDIYNQFISLDHIKELLMTTKSPLAELNILKKLCDHPRLLSARAVSQLGLEEGRSANLQDDENECAANRIDNISDETLITESGKLVFLVALLERLKQEGHRTLVFSQSRKMLDIIERVLVNKHFKVVRVDGTIIHLTERERRISLFQTNKQYSVFLLTTQVGGVGITLTAADRVVIFDPSWNPATDAQAVDRAYRIGQTENVVIYRLITCGTVEEKIYRRQIFKDSLIRQTTGDKKNPFRYFSRQELKELFTLQDTRSSSTQLQLQSLHSRQRRTDVQLDEHIAHLHTMEMFGISDHDLMFTHEADHHEDAPEDQEAHHYIENRVQIAQELMKAESELHKQFADSVESNTEPAWLRKPAQQNTMGSTDRKPKDARPSPSFPNNAFEQVDLTQSGPDDENDIPNLSDKFIDLVVDEEEEPTSQSRSEDKLLEINHVSHIDQSLEEVGTDGEALSVSVEEVMDMSSAPKDINAVEHEGLEYITSPVDQGKLQNQNAFAQLEDLSLDQESSMDIRDLPGKSHDGLEYATSPVDQDEHQNVNSSARFESFQGNFNLQLEDSASDMFPEEEPDIQERKSGFQLQMDGSFSGDEKSATNGAGGQHGVSVNDSLTSDLDRSVDDSLIFSVRKKKGAAVIYDSEEDEEEEGTCELNEPFNSLGSSTPKSIKTASTSFKARKSFGGNTSVASRRSLVESVIEDLKDLDEDMEDEKFSVNGRNGGGMTEEEEEEPSGETPGTEKDESDECGSEYVEGSEIEEDSISALEESTSNAVNENNGGRMTESHDESLMEEEEPSGETLGTEKDESEEDGSESMYVEASEIEEDSVSALEESTSDAELASGERIDQCTTGKYATLEKAECMKNPDYSSVTEGKEYESLVKKGKQCYTDGKLDDALRFFLSAIDIKSGDPEIQLMTIQLYRRLNQKTGS